MMSGDMLGESLVANSRKLLRATYEVAWSKKYIVLAQNKIPIFIGLLSWGERWGLNPRPPDPQTSALTN